MTREEQLWISDQGRLVCERVSCAGEELVNRIILARGLERSIPLGRERFSRMTVAEMAEYAPLLSVTGGKLECGGGHVRYDPRARALQTIGVTA